jgi:hypothetical protein
VSTTICARRSSVLRTRSTQPRSTMRSSVTARFGGDTSSALPSCFWFTCSFEATSVRMANSTAFNCSGPMCLLNDFFNSTDARVAA